MPIRAHFFRRMILTRKVGQTGVLSEFISLVGLCIQDYIGGYDLFHADNILTSLHMKSSAS